MKCSDEVKKEILAAILGWIRTYENAGFGADELKMELVAFVGVLNQQYDKACVLEVLRSVNAERVGPQN